MKFKPTSQPGSPEPIKKLTDAEKMMLYSEAKEYILTLLISPGSARFPQLGDPAVTIFGGIEDGTEGDNVDPFLRIKSTVGDYEISGYVDSQNSFGALLRSKWTCDLRLDGTRAKILFAGDPTCYIHKNS